MEPPLLGREEGAGPASLEGGAGAFSEVWSFSGRHRVEGGPGSPAVRTFSVWGPESGTPEMVLERAAAFRREDSRALS